MRTTAEIEARIAELEAANHAAPHNVGEIRARRLEISQLKSQLRARHAMTPGELHNQIAAELVSTIIREPVACGGKMSDSLVLLETVIFGVVLFGVKFGGDETVLNSVVDNVKRRLAEHRFAQASVVGRA
jgi:hypothetical protein